MRFLVRFSISCLILGCLFIVASKYFSARTPAALSRAHLYKSLGTQDLGHSFIFQMPADQQLGKIARDFIVQRKKEWHPEKSSSIPLKIHQIWPFEESLPDELARTSSLLIMQHPSFSYTLWKPADFSPLLEETLGDSWKQLSPCIIRDLAAAQILLKEGGIVVDLEAECVHPLTQILPFGNCIMGFEPPLPKPCYSRRLFLSPSLIASVPNHKTIALWAKKMTTRAKYATNNASIDPLFICSESLTSVVASAECSEKLILLGPTFFSPIAPMNIKKLHSQLDGKKKLSLFRKILESCHLRSKVPFSSIEDETIFVQIHGGRFSRKCFENMKIPKGTAIDNGEVG